MTPRSTLMVVAASVMLIVLPGCTWADSPAAGPSGSPSATTASTPAPATADPLPTIPRACADLFSDSTASGLLFSPVSLKIDQATVRNLYEASGLQAGLLHCVWGGQNKTDNGWDQTIDVNILPDGASAFDASVWKVDDGAIVYPVGSTTSEYLCPLVEGNYGQCYANALVNGYWAHVDVQTGGTGTQLTRDGMESSMRSIVDRLTAALSTAGAGRRAWTAPTYSLTGAICGGRSIVPDGSSSAPAVAAQRAGAVRCDYAGGMSVSVLPGGGWAPSSMKASGLPPYWSIPKLEQASVPGAALAFWGCGESCYSILSIGGSAVSITTDIPDGPTFLAKLPAVVAAITAAG